MPPANDQSPKAPATAGRRAMVLIASVCAVLLFAAAGILWLVTAPPEAAASAIGGSFQLTDGQGKPVTDKDFRGKYMLIYFGYTFCPDVCPTTLSHVAAAMNVLGAKAEAVQPIFITVDPKRDTPAVIGPYVAAFTPKLVGLTGTPAQIGSVERVYQVYAAVHPPEDGKGEYTVDHSSLLYLMGPDGSFVAPIPADDSGTDIAAEIVKGMAG